MPKKVDERYQAEVMGIVGYAIYQCQQVEAVVSTCWHLFSKRVVEPDGEIYFEIWNLDDLVKKTRKEQWDSYCSI